MKTTTKGNQQATTVIMGAAIAIVLLVAVVMAAERQVWDTTLDCTTYLDFEPDRADDYTCIGHFYIDETMNRHQYSGGFAPEYDIYCRGYSLLPSGHDLEEVQKRDPLPRPAVAQGGVLQIGLEPREGDMFNNPTAIQGRFDVGDDEFYVCEARKIIDNKLEWIECKKFNDVGICKESELQWTLYANNNGISERMEISNGRWVVIKSNEFTRIEIEYAGVTVVEEPEPEPEPEPLPPIGGLF